MGSLNVQSTDETHRADILVTSVPRERQETSHIYLMLCLEPSRLTALELNGLNYRQPSSHQMNRIRTKGLSVLKYLCLVADLNFPEFFVYILRIVYM